MGRILVTLILLSKVDESFECDDGEVVKEISSVEFGMEGDPSDVPFDMGVEFGLMVHIPLSQSNPDVLRRMTLDAMSIEHRLN